MLERLYVVTGWLELPKVSEMIRRRESVMLSVQKYVAVNNGPFKRAWAEPAQCALKPNSLGNDMVLSEDSQLVNISGRVVDVGTTRPASEMGGFDGAKELSGLSLNFYYDCERAVGVIIDGYNGLSQRPAIAPVRLDMVVSDDELVSREAMRLRGIPEELHESRTLLSEMSRA